MNFVSVGDLSRFFTMRRASSGLRNDIQRLSQEVTTGIRADVARHLGGNLHGLSHMERGLREAEAYRLTTQEAAATASGMQAAFGTLQDIADSSSVSMISDTSLAVEHTLLSVAATADSQLSTAIAALNTNVGGRFLLSGTKSNTPPVVSPEELLAQAQSVISGATNANEAVQLLKDWFNASPGEDGFSDMAYKGSQNGGTSFGIDASNTIRFEQTANDAGARNVLFGLTLGALVSRGAFGGEQTEQAIMMRAGGGALIEGNAQIALSRADLGMSEQSIERANIRLGSLSTGLKIERSNLISVDGYEAGSKLIQSEARLESLFALTARLSNLSLAKHL
ncbi:MAG: flagellin [Paracoccus sp. (in: a-proteobacteria)]|nr:flagellin [Paracoccus sp. (in: a-proteobacteria)]